MKLGATNDFLFCLEAFYPRVDLLLEARGQKTVNFDNQEQPQDETTSNTTRLREGIGGRERRGRGEGGGGRGEEGGGKEEGEEREEGRDRGKEGRGKGKRERGGRRRRAA